MDPHELIRHANRLIRPTRGAPKQIDLRRAISAAYYALFHCLLRAAADDLVGATAKARRSSSYTLIYRAFDHSVMLRTCEDALKPTLPERLKAVLGASSFPKEIQYAAQVFMDLQGLRQVADYNPNVRFYKSDALDAIVRASFATMQFAQADKEMRRLFILIMLFKPR